MVITAGGFSTEAISPNNITEVGRLKTTIVMLMMRTNRMISGWWMLIRSPGSEDSEAGRPLALDDEGFPGGEVH